MINVLSVNQNQKRYLISSSIVCTPSFSGNSSNPDILKKKQTNKKKSTEIEKLAPFLHSKMFVAVIAIVLIWTVS